ncbi:MAG: hypothetical protein ACRC1J_12675 [Sandaracinobacteroides sp.]
MPRMRSNMRGLMLIVSEAGGERFAAAMELAAASAALAHPVAVLLRGPAVPALQAGGMLDMLFELGAEVTVCQTAMAAYGLGAADLPPGAEAAGLIGFLSGREGWQIVLA